MRRVENLGERFVDCRMGGVTVVGVQLKKPP